MTTLFLRNVSLYPGNIPCSKIFLSMTNIATPTFFWLMFTWYINFDLFILLIFCVLIFKVGSYG